MQKGAGKMARKKRKKKKEKNSNSSFSFLFFFLITKAMTSAHRPTFTPALGNAKTLTESYSARNSTVVPMKNRFGPRAPFLN